MKAESVRQKKVAAVLQTELGVLFQQDVKSIFGNMFITVTQVKVTPDLRDARVYLSFFTKTEEEKQDSLFRIQEAQDQIKRLLVRKIGKQLRVMPTLTFLVDDIDEEAARMEKLINTLDIPDETHHSDLGGIYKTDL